MAILTRSLDVDFGQFWHFGQLLALREASFGFQEASVDKLGATAKERNGLFGQVLGFFLS